MEFGVIFYATEDDDKPVVQFLDSLRGTNDPLHKLVTAGIRKLKQRDNHGPPLTDHVHGSTAIMELRVGRRNIARVFFFFRPNQQIICTNSYVKKTQKIDPREVARAERYKSDWERRFPA